MSTGVGASGWKSIFSVTWYPFLFIGPDPLLVYSFLVSPALPNNLILTSFFGLFDGREWHMETEMTCDTGHQPDLNGDGAVRSYCVGLHWVILGTPRTWLFSVWIHLSLSSICDTFSMSLPPSCRGNHAPVDLWTHSYTHTPANSLSFPRAVSVLGSNS